jgi:hypothetical protein
MQEFVAHRINEFVLALKARLSGTSVQIHGAPTSAQARFFPRADNLKPLLDVLEILIYLVL